MIRMTSLLLLASFVTFLVAGCESVKQIMARDVPYETTLETVVDKMLELAEVKPDDVVYDLGSGDGRIVIAAAKKYGARGVGIDIDPERIREARENAQAAGVAERVKFHEGDFFKTELSDATVVTLYLLPDVNARLGPKLWRELKPGTRIVSHRFAIGNWKPDKKVIVEGRPVYYWVIPEKKAARR